MSLSSLSLKCVVNIPAKGSRPEFHRGEFPKLAHRVSSKNRSVLRRMQGFVPLILCHLYQPFPVISHCKPSGHTTDAKRFFSKQNNAHSQNLFTCANFFTLSIYRHMSVYLSKLHRPLKYPNKYHPFI